MGNDDTIRLAGIENDSIVDGPGLRLSIFVQGCSHNCVGCHNPGTHDPNGGVEKPLSEFTQWVTDELEKNPLLAGITLSGGEPIEQVKQVLAIAKAVVAMRKTVVLFSGYTYEQLMEMSKNNACILELLNLCILLVDGEFVLRERDLSLKFRGSRNQRLIDPKKSIEAGKPVEWRSKFDNI